MYKKLSLSRTQVFWIKNAVVGLIMAFLLIILVEHTLHSEYIITDGKLIINNGKLSRAKSIDINNYCNVVLRQLGNPVSGLLEVPGLLGAVTPTALMGGRGNSICKTI